MEEGRIWNIARISKNKRRKKKSFKENPVSNQIWK
jgi:hypothetical protein